MGSPDLFDDPDTGHTPVLERYRYGRSLLPPPYGGKPKPDTRASIDTTYLGPSHVGVPLAFDPKHPLPSVAHPADVLGRDGDEQRIAVQPRLGLLRAR